DKSALHEFRIGVWFDTPESPLDAEYRSMLGATVDALADAGAKVDDEHPPVEFGEQSALFYHLVGAATSVSAPADQGEASAGSHHGWLRADKERARLRRVWAQWFEDYDLLLCPVLAVPPFRHHREGPIMERTIDLGGEPRSLVSLIAWPGFIGVIG